MSDILAQSKPSSDGALIASHPKLSGFTLLELLIVIAIIGILAAVLIPNLIGARARAYDSAALGCAKQISLAQEIYHIDADTYAAAVGSLDPGIIKTCNTNWISNFSGNSSTFSVDVKHPSGTGKIFTLTPNGFQ